MFFDSVEQIPKIAKNTGFSIFSVDVFPKFFPKNTIFLRPDEKTNKISIDDVRKILSLTTTRRIEEFFFVVEYPEKMSLEALNAFLKNLEEPKEKYHFVFLTKNLTNLPETVLSRAQIYIKNEQNFLEREVQTSEKAKDFAKKLMVARNTDLPKLAKDLADKKDRNFVLDVVSASIELSYKSFFRTKDPRFLKKLPNLLKLHENLTANGNIKLHIVADLL